MARPILSLSPKATEAFRLKTTAWVCKPCGARLTLDPDGADDDVVRCPTCQAKLGKLAAFKRPDEAGQVRARKVPLQDPPKV